jgi:hypothetical protein
MPGIPVWFLHIKSRVYTRGGQFDSGRLIVPARATWPTWLAVEKDRSYAKDSQSRFGEPEAATGERVLS